MVFDDWRDAVRYLRQNVEPADLQQLELASTVGIDIAPDTPALVAAALLERHLAEQLRAGSERPVSEAQEEFLADLCEDLSCPRPDAIQSYQTMSAWLSVLVARRAIAALEREQPRRGDIVADQRDPDKTVTISSIGSRGLIYPRGPAVRRIPAHRLTVIVRADDRSPAADTRRRTAANARAMRASPSAPSTAQMAALDPYRCVDGPDVAVVDLLRETLDKATDERPLQELIERHPEILAGLTTNSWGCFVRPQVSLAGQLIPDFLLAIANSGGVHWTLVEIESPAAKRVGTRKGTLGDSARKGVQQIEDWREWLTGDLAHARDNIGLIGIRPESPGLVIVGRRGLGPWPLAHTRQRLHQDRNILLHSWDWLVEALEHGAGIDRPGGPLDWRDWHLRE